MKISGFFLCGALSICCSPVCANSVTVLQNSDDAQACALEARLASADPGGNYYSASACTRALEMPNLFTARDLAALHINRGILLASQQEYQSAFEDYKRALELKASLPETYVNLGNLYYLSAKFTKALELYDKSLALGIGRAHVVYVNRGMAFEKLGQTAQAVQSYERALTIVPEWPLAVAKLTALRTQADSGQ